MRSNAKLVFNPQNIDTHTQKKDNGEEQTSQSSRREANQNAESTDKPED